MENSIARYLRLAEKKGSDSSHATVFSTVVSMIFCWIFTVSQLKKLVSENWKIFNLRFYLLLLLIDIATKFTYREPLSKKFHNDNKTYKI
jgi:peptidoglycan biosynthesis protein MviN/MurJ (putative lipid II flippase)